MENPVGYWLKESFGLRGGRNLLAWATAGGLAYYFWVLPEQQDAERRKRIIEEWKAKYADDPVMYPVDKIRPQPDTSTMHNGLLVGEGQQKAAAGRQVAAQTQAAAPASAAGGSSNNAADG